MGDLQAALGESPELQFVPVSEFERVRAAGAPGGGEPAVVSAVAIARAFAALARINTLSMIAGAWSGHIGTSLSSLEIMSWLFLNELRDLEKGPDACDIVSRRMGTTHRPFTPCSPGSGCCHQTSSMPPVPQSPYVSPEAPSGEKLGVMTQTGEAGRIVKVTGATFILPNGSSAVICAGNDGLLMSLAGCTLVPWNRDAWDTSRRAAPGSRGVKSALIGHK
jgi:hypothetical protein